MPDFGIWQIFKYFFFYSFFDQTVSDLKVQGVGFSCINLGKKTYSLCNLEYYIRFLGLNPPNSSTLDLLKSRFFQL